MLERRKQKKKEKRRAKLQEKQEAAEEKKQAAATDQAPAVHWLRYDPARQAQPQWDAAAAWGAGWASTPAGRYCWGGAWPLQLAT